jgi:four helix bundle protein
MHNFRELIAWQKSRLLVKSVYVLTSQFASDEKYGMTSQLRRAVVSIASNIAEGAGRTSEQDFARFIDIANGSAFEVECQLILCGDLGLVPETEVDKHIEEVKEVQRLLFGLKKKIVSDVRK